MPGPGPSLPMCLAKNSSHRSMKASSNDSTVRDKSNATFSDFLLLILSLASLLLVVVEVVKVEEVMVGLVLSVR